MDERPPILRATSLCRSFPSGRETVQVLRGLSIDIPRRSLVMLKGRSGSGKTTLINLLGALDRPDSGTIHFNGLLTTELPERDRDALRRRRFGFVFQSVALISTMTAFENVDFGLRVAGYDRRSRTARAEEALHLVGLEKRLTHRTQELSGGEQQRVAIARAFAHRPDVVFADEPTAELDTAMGLQIVKLVRMLVEREGMTVVMTTHDPDMMELADLVCSLDEEVAK